MPTNSAVHHATAPGLTASGTSRTAGPLRAACRAALAWVWLFIAFHVYWFAGGTVGFGDASTTVPVPRSAAGWSFTVVVGVLFVAGAVLPLALHRPWGRAVPSWLLLLCSWAGALLLGLRGLAGLVDTAIRLLGVQGGLTGLSEQQVTGDAHPTGLTQWSGTCIDLYFFLGGVLFAVAAARYRRCRREPAGGTG